MPVLPFLIGLVVGAAAVTTLRGDRGRAAMQEASERLREVYGETGAAVRAATVSGLDRVREAIAPTAAAPAAAAPKHRKQAKASRKKASKSARAG